VGESIGAVRTSFRQLVGAHIQLLQVEMARATEELKVIVALAAVALVIALLSGILLYVGGWLFLGEWLFGSIGWGLIQGLLMAVIVIIPIGLNLAGGWLGAWSRGFLVGLIVAIVLAVFFASGIPHTIATNTGNNLQANLSVDLPDLMTAIVMIGWVLTLILGAIAARFRIVIILAGLVGLVTAVVAFALVFGWIFITFNQEGLVALAITFGLITWIAVSGWLASRHGFDPKGRYANLVPRESQAQFLATRAYLVQQWQQQRKKLAGR